jgi:hypothetical protein
MSKRKNTLNDLEEFLKLQASTLVAPQPVQTVSASPAVESQAGDTVRGTVPKIEDEQVRAVQPQEVVAPQPIPVAQPKPLDLLTEMRKLATQNRNGFYDAIIQSAETMPNGKSDVLLINTALYLKHGENWKHGIEEYWRAKKGI